MSRSTSPGSRNTSPAVADFVTVIVGGQTFGLPVAAVHDFFRRALTSSIPRNRA
jgi:hypothetical protein